MRVAKLFFEQSKSLDYLSIVERADKERPHRNFNLPSWTPDWTVPINRSSLFKDGKKPPQWAKDNSNNSNSQTGWENISFTRFSQGQCTFNFSQRTITLTGFIVDTIHKAAHRFVDLTPPFKAVRAKTFGHRICWQPQDPSEYAEHSSFWSGKLPQMHSRLPQRNPLLSEIGPILGPDDNIPATSLPDPPRADFVCFGTKERGYVGEADWGIMEGDSICALLGANVPYILRRHRDVWIRIGPW
jgi:hypothetical protein